ncbi:cysteine desulfurase family protein [Thalassobacillus sp. CUG 92003]|uniref:cysteine desulfurase family protein n=1 Tax=Thalassobacillus sp. CUG 92003 TaxID=2736641 RepID=UPI0015E67162|nr:cysteine desulfurase family protein [Thalassobacillus sp. CUG 92003]
MKAIYLDHAATTPVHPKVVEAMLPVYQDVFGNPSSVHQFGRQARRVLDEARRIAARSLNVQEKELIFTSGGTEADNLALIGTAEANRHKGKHIITSRIEHHATLHAAEHLERRGFEVTYLPVNDQGVIAVEDVQEHLRDDTIVVSIMMVNNETGVMQPIQEIADLVSSHQAYFHTDAVQAFGTLSIDLQTLPVDMLTISSHKINGPKGVGLLFVREGTKIDARQHGGEQERKRRPGTENIPGIKGFATAIALMQDEAEYPFNYAQYKRSFLAVLQENGIAFSINGDPDKTVDTIVNISFPNINVETLLTNLDLSGVAASSGSACTAGSVEPSHVLSAMYASEDERPVNSIRFSFGQANTEDDVVEAAHRISQVVARLRTQ